MVIKFTEIESIHSLDSSVLNSRHPVLAHIDIFNSISN